MHEFSVMSQLVDALVEESKKRNAVKVEEVFLELGEFTMLGEEQLRYAYDLLSKGSILEGSSLTIRRNRGVIECGCGFKGEITPPEDLLHRGVPILECPKCGALGRVVSGRECTVRNVRLVVPDV